MLAKVGQMPAKEVNLLIVEDDVHLRQLLSVILKRSGYRVRSAQDGFAGLAEIRAETPDVILSDLYMSGMSGFEMLSVIRRRFPSIRVVAMSSAYAGGDVPAGVAADAYYEKATGVDALLKTVEVLSSTPTTNAFPVTREEAPIWIPTNGHGPSGEACVTIGCPECLRSFPAVHYEVTRAVHETDCIHCHSHIQYALVHLFAPTPSVQQMS
jgi:CheY-like chemotaxis protein